MPKVLLDEKEFTAATEFHTWGGLLLDIDARLAGSGRIVTDARFDGLDEPGFREPDTVGRSLEELATLEVFSGTPRGLMTRCLEEALAAISPLCEAAWDVGEQYRGQDIRAAGNSLAELADGLASLVAIVDAAGSALRVDLRQVRCGDVDAADLVVQFGGHLAELVSAQETGDWLTVANVLQYGLGPSLKRLAPVLESLRLGGAEQACA